MTGSTFKDKVVVITGASSGIGRELACQLAGQGAWLSLAARDVERLAKVRAECQTRGGRAILVQTDVSQQSQCESLIQETVKKYERIDVLVNNAGITMWAKFEDLQDLGLVEQIMRINFFGSVYCTHHALPYLKQTKGQIVAVSSLTGKTGIPTRSAYAASKHAMAGFFDSLRIEIAEYGVDVTTIYPDFVSSEVRERALGPDGLPLGTSPVREKEVMSTETCAEMIIQAMEQRKRELIMSFRGRIGQWLKLIAPRVVDRIALRAINQGR